MHSSHSLLGIEVGLREGIVDLLSGDLLKQGRISTLSRYLEMSRDVSSLNMSQYVSICLNMSQCCFFKALYQLPAECPVS